MGFLLFLVRADHAMINVKMDGPGTFNNSQNNSG